jgi:hypothetical protein
MVATTGRDLSHYNTITDYAAARAAVDWVQIKLTEGTDGIDPLAPTHYRGFQGKPRGGYHFCGPGDIPGQVANFLARKARIGPFERLDMLDCEFTGITGAYIAAFVAEYRRQSGTRAVSVYAGLDSLRHACDPALWWDADIRIWASRYRKVGPPKNPTEWADHLGWDHPGLVTYQWDDAAPLPGGGRTDINQEREAAMSGEADGEIVFARTHLTTGRLAGKRIADVWIDSRVDIMDILTTVGQLAAKVDALAAKVDALSSTGLRLAADGQIVVKAV